MNPIAAPATIAAAAASIRELGEMLQVAEQHPDFYGRLMEVERLAGRVQARLDELRDRVCDEWLNVSGFSESRRRDGGS